MPSGHGPRYDPPNMAARPAQHHDTLVEIDAQGVAADAAGLARRFAKDPDVRGVTTRGDAVWIAANTIDSGHAMVNRLRRLVRASRRVP